MWGTYNVFRVAARQMIAQQIPGSLLAISSPHAFMPIARSTPYNMAKAAVDQMAKTAALELAEHRIRVNLIHPGWTDTPGEREFTSDDEIAQASAKLVWKRLAKSDEIARGAVFLCDPASDYLTGTSLLIDGGFTLPWWSLPTKPNTPKT
jgi:glucose 1-dehydrogenase